jgi:hypothetical protein
VEEELSAEQRVRRVEVKEVPVAAGVPAALAPSAALHLAACVGVRTPH